MKSIRNILILFSVIAFSVGCQKELTFESDGFSFGEFKKDVAGDCLPVYVNSNFYVDTVLTNLDYVDVQIEVSTEGAYDIRSDTINGYSFSKAGTAYPGTNTIRLYPSGKPIAAGINTFTLTYGTSTCKFDISVISLAPTGASFTLGGSPGNCTGVVLGGTYTAGTAMTASNTALIDVNVATTGTFSVSSNTVNGISFSGGGTFTATGPQQVILTGSGTPGTAGTFTIQVVAGANTCAFSLVVN